MLRFLSRTLRYDARHPEDHAAWGLRVALLAALLTIPLFAASLLDGATLAVVTLAGLVGALVIGCLDHAKGRNARVVEVVWSGMFALNWLGQAWNLYNAFAWYDKILHGAGGLVAGIAAYAIITGTRWLADPETLTPFRVFYLVSSLVIVAGVAVELVEFGSDAVLGTESQRSPIMGAHADTMLDIVAETVTGVAVALWSAVAIARKGEVRMGDDERARRRVRAARGRGRGE